jgi:hypothetical protein
MTACNCGYGMLPVVELLAQKRFKVVTVCHAAGSQHHIAGSNTINGY